MMYRPPSKNQSRAPSRNMARLGHQPLVIRTTNPSTQPANQPGSSSSPPPQPYPTYPIPIPPEKHAKALRIYIQYRYEEGLEQRRAEQATAMGNHDGSHLGVPGPPTLYSIASYSSAGHTATSIATSAYEEGQVTDMSSLMSFTDNESPSSAKARAEAELTAFNGSKVKQRVRKKLSPKAKAKAALVRWLGSCWVCRSRRVPCPLEHHDIGSLESARLARSYRHQSQQQSRSSNSSSSQRTAENTSARQAALGGFQAVSLLGLGQNEELLFPPTALDTTHLDAQSPGGVFHDPLAEIPAPDPSHYRATDMSTGPYSTYQNNDMVAIGVRRGYFYCQHLDGLCQEYFEDPDSLQTHFEINHFPFTHINPAHRLLCSVCHCLNNYPTGPCSQCRTHGSIELWIYGHFIRIPSRRRHDPDTQDLLRNVPSSNKYYSSSYGPPSVGSQWDADPNNNGSFGDGANEGHYHYQDGNTYSGPPPQGYDYGSYNGPQPGGYQPQGNSFSWARQTAPIDSNAVRFWYSKTVQTCRHHKLVLLTFILLVAIMLGFTHDWIISKTRMAIPRAAAGFRTHLPMIGFVSVVGSGAMCWSLKHLSVQRVRRAQCRPRRYLVHALTPISDSLRCREVAPPAATYTRGEGYL